MKIIDERTSKSEIKEYELGKVYLYQDLIYMAVKTDNNYQLVNLKNGKSSSFAYDSLKQLYAWCHHDGEQLIDAELIIRGGDQK